MKQHTLHGLYGISDNALTPQGKILTFLESAICGGLKIFQYRDKDSRDKDSKNGEIENLLLELQHFCDERDVLFVLNDRIDLALKLKVSGLHVGKDELDYTNPQKFIEIRESFEGVIGVSCYDSIHLALNFENLGADYVAFGSIFPSKIKPNATKCSIEILKQAREKLHIPICAIGGIDSQNAKMLRQYCDMIAVISSLWHLSSESSVTESITRNARELLQSFDS